MLRSILYRFLEGTWGADTVIHVLTNSRCVFWLNSRRTLNVAECSESAGPWDQFLQGFDPGVGMAVVSFLLP